jgi:hypothetical protein
MTTLSLHRFWVLYKRSAITHGVGESKQDLALAQIAFYSGARAVLKVLDHPKRTRKQLGRPRGRKDNPPSALAHHWPKPGRATAARADDFSQRSATAERLANT